MKWAACPQPWEAGQPMWAGESLWFVWRILETGGISEMIQKACFGSWSKGPWGYLISSKEHLCGHCGHTHCMVTGRLSSLQPHSWEIRTLLVLPWGQRQAAFPPNQPSLCPLLPSCWACYVFDLGWVFTGPDLYCLVGFIPLSYGWYRFAPKMKSVVLPPLASYGSFLQQGGQPRNCVPGRHTCFLGVNSNLNPHVLFSILCVSFSVWSWCCIREKLTGKGS